MQGGPCAGWRPAPRPLWLLGTLDASRHRRLLGPPNWPPFSYRPPLRTIVTSSRAQSSDTRAPLVSDAGRLSKQGRHLNPMVSKSLAGLHGVAAVFHLQLHQPPLGDLKGLEHRDVDLVLRRRLHLSNLACVALRGFSLDGHICSSGDRFVGARGDRGSGVI